MDPEDMSAQRLSDAWAKLRNQALGRGTRPNVSSGLAALVADEHAAWRGFAGSAASNLQELGPWRDRYNKVATKVAAELGLPTVPKAPPGLLERGAVDAAEAVVDAASAVGKGIGLLGIGLAVVYVFAQGLQRR